VPGDGLPEAVARGVSARGCQCRQYVVQVLYHEQWRLHARGPEARPGQRVIVLRRRVPSPVAAVQTDAEPPGPARPERRVCIVIVRRRAYGACGFFFFPLSYLWLSVFHDYLGLSKTKCADCDFVVCSNCIWLQN
jgi:hypothetical protein